MDFILTVIWHGFLCILMVVAFSTLIGIITGIVNYIPNKLHELVRHELERQKERAEIGLQNAQFKDSEKLRQKKLVADKNKFEIEELKRIGRWLLSPIEENELVHLTTSGQTGSGMNSTLASRIQFDENPLPDYIEERQQRHELQLAKEKDRQAVIAHKENYRYEIECLKKQGKWLLTEDEEKKQVGE